MPAQKRSLPESMEEEEETSQLLQQSRHVKHHREPHFIDQLEQEEDEEDDDDDQQEQDDEEDEQGEEEEDDEEEAEDDDDDEDEEEGQHHDDDKEKSQDSDESSDSEEKPEYVYVELSDIRKDVQCPICLGIIKKTRTVMECLHRFCRECIDKSMRLGNNECPACRTHCASRRSLRDDPNYDALIATLYPNIEKYEEEELEFREEEKNRNKQIQASIAKVFKRQSEALSKKRKDTPSSSSFVTRSQRNQRNLQSRRQNQASDIQGSEENEENGNNERDSSSGDEGGTELRQRKRKRWTRVRSNQPSSSMASPDGGSIESDLDINRENRGTSRLVTKARKLTWGRGGFRSNTRYGSGGGSNGKSSRSGRMSRLVDYLKNLNENTDEFDVHLMFVSLDKETTPRLEKLHLCCRPNVSVKNLYEYVASQTPLTVEEVEILAVKGCSSANCDKSADEDSVLDFDELSSLFIDPQKDELEILQAHETVAEIKSKSIFKRGHLILAYKRKV